MDDGLPVSAYRSVPLVLGVIGESDDKDAAMFFEAAPGARVLVRNGQMEVRAVGPIVERGIPGFYWGAGLHSTDVVTRWSHVSEELCAAGLVREKRGWVLFTDSLGINSVYVRERGGSLYFATRIAPLIALSGRLNVNWEAWSSILVVGSPLGQSTPFLEISRLEGATGFVIGDGADSRVVSYVPNWLNDEVPFDPKALGAAMREALPPRAALPEPPAITLSGGWDSRLIGGIAADTYRGRLHAWTSAVDDGRERDMSMAPAVAEALGMRHTTVPLPDSGWPDLASETRIRAQFETWLHPWLAPLCRRLRNEEHNVLDGLGGDVLLKGLFVDNEVLNGQSDQQLQRLFRRTGYRPDQRFVGRFRDGPAAAVVELSRQSFDGIARRFCGHVNQLALSVLHTRTARAVAISPSCLFAPEVRPWFPFLAPQVLAMSLGVDPGRKVDGSFYRKVLHRCAPSVADLPSTNDPDVTPSTPSQRLQAGVESATWMLDLIMMSETVSSLFMPDFLSSLQSSRESWSTPGAQMQRLLMACSLFAQWEIQYRSRLVSSTPPW